MSKYSPSANISVARNNDTKHFGCSTAHSMDDRSAHYLTTLANHVHVLSETTKCNLICRKTIIGRNIFLLYLSQVNQTTSYSWLCNKFTKLYS